MDVESFREYCLKKPHVTEEFPFDKSTLVFKVAGKLFALTNLEAETFKVNLKCNPEYAVELREEFPEDVTAGYHMNKKHWNTVNFEAGISSELLKKWVDDSFDLVVQSMSKKKQKELGFMG